MELIKNDKFYVSNKDIYPPFKNGLYMEEYFLEQIKDNNIKYNKEGRLYIPVLWTNFQIEKWFKNEKHNMQEILNKYIENNKCDKGYFTIVQHDDGPLLKLPHNTIIYGACSGNIPLPLIYQDINNTLYNKFLKSNKTFKEKSILCSFVGTNTHNIRNIINNKFKNNTNFEFRINSNWTPNVNINLQNKFIDLTLNSKFALAPRGYGRSSFRFFEIFKLGSIPIYVWDDIEWLPYKDKINYNKICISININEIDKLENLLLNITENEYNNMLNEYNKIKHMFELDYIYKYIC